MASPHAQAVAFLMAVSACLSPSKERVLEMAISAGHKEVAVGKIRIIAIQITIYLDQENGNSSVFE